jgi:hypothetical protein
MGLSERWKGSEMERHDAMAVHRTLAMYCIMLEPIIHERSLPKATALVLRIIARILSPCMCTCTYRDVPGLPAPRCRNVIVLEAEQY